MRVTRNADITVDEGLFDFDIDFRGVMEEMLKKRRRLDVVRLQFSSRPGDRLSAFLCKKLKVEDDCFSIQSIPLDFSFGFALPSALDPHKEQKNWYLPRGQALCPGRLCQRGRRRRHQLPEKSRHAAQLPVPEHQALCRPIV